MGDDLLERPITDESITHAPKQPKITINTAISNIDQKRYFPGDSVVGHKQLEEANAIITGDEIKQQNENL